MRTCSIEGCGRKYDARGFCKVHYGNWRRHNDPHTVSDRIFLTPDEHQKRKSDRYRRWASKNKEYLNTKQRARRVRNPDKVRAAARAYRQKHLDLCRRRDHRTKWKGFDIVVALQQQGSMCDACGIKEPTTKKGNYIFDYHGRRER